VNFRNLPQVVICVLCFGLATAAFAATCPGSIVTVNLTSPTGSGTYSVPVHFEATASSSVGAGITGYAVYTNQWSDIPFAEGEPVYLNGIATLNAWVVLPETVTGGSLSQDVFVRAWDADGNCGDSATLDITASGASIPNSFPSGYQQWTNTENDEENSNSGNVAGWWDCTGKTCAGGVNGGTVNFTFDQTSPELNGNPSIEFTLTGPPGADGLFWYKVPPIGEQDSMQNFVWDFYFYLSANDTVANTAALEFDVFQAVDGYKYMIGTQCNYHPSGVSHPIWNTWDATTGNWVPAVRNTETDNNPGTTNAIACGPFTTGAWHHLQYYLQRTHADSTYPQGRILYGTVSVDGSPTVWDISAPAVSSTWGDVLGLQHQQDIYSGVSGTLTLQEWADEDDLTAWPQD
jgi:hypothetical protein